MARPGLAQQGLDVYRANGCAYCHSQQVGQNGTFLEVALTEVGTNQPAVIDALLKLTKATEGQSAFVTALPELEAARAGATNATLLTGLPKAFLRSASREAADNAVKTLNSAGLKAQLWIVPAGPDLDRGWGKRRTVAEISSMTHR